MVVNSDTQNIKVPVTWISEQYLIHFCVCTYEYSIQVQLSKTADFSSALTATVTIFNMVEVERIEDNASLYGCSISGHHVCLLVKALVRETCH